VLACSSSSGVSCPALPSSGGAGTYLVLFYPSCCVCVCHEVRDAPDSQEHALTSDELLVLEDIPRLPMVFVGAGYISLEFASIFAGAGAEVHLLNRGDLPLAG
jgi:Pyridine nucleotide-disulphide oxidoreductase